MPDLQNTPKYYAKTTCLRYECWFDFEFASAQSVVTILWEQRTLGLQKVHLLLLFRRPRGHAFSRQMHMHPFKVTGRLPEPWIFGALFFVVVSIRGRRPNSFCVFKCDVNFALIFRILQLRFRNEQL